MNIIRSSRIAGGGGGGDSSPFAPEIRPRKRCGGWNTLTKFNAMSMGSHNSAMKKTNWKETLNFNLNGHPTEYWMYAQNYRLLYWITGRVHWVSGTWIRSFDEVFDIIFAVVDILKRSHKKGGVGKNRIYASNAFILTVNIGQNHDKCQTVLLHNLRNDIKILHLNVGWCMCNTIYPADL